MRRSRHRRRRRAGRAAFLTTLGGILAVILAFLASSALRPAAGPAPALGSGGVSEKHAGPGATPTALSEPPATPSQRTPPPAAAWPGHPPSGPAPSAGPAPPAGPAPSPGPRPSTSPVPVPPGPLKLSLSSAFNNVGVASDSDPAAGNLDGSGSAFSAQALAAAGARPGATITSGSVPFTWPDVAPGRPDNVTASGQALPASGSGTSMAFLVTAGWGPASGAGTVAYADGSTQAFTMSSPDWYRSCLSASTPGTALFTPYRDQGNGRASFTSCVYYVSVRLDATKKLLSIRLPDVSAAVPGPGGSSLHIFAVTIIR